MVLAPRHGDAGGPPVEHDASDALLESRHDVVDRFVRLRVQCSGERSGDAGQRRGHLGDGVVLHEHRDGPEALLQEHVGAFKERADVGGDDHRADGTGCLGGVPRDDPRRSVVPQTPDPGRERLGNAIGEQSERGALGHALVQTSVVRDSARHEDQSRLGAELSPADGEGGHEPVEDRVAPGGDRAGGDDDRVRAPELAEERDRVGTPGDLVHQALRPGERPGEGRGADERCPHEIQTRLATLDETEGAGRRAGGGERVGHDPRGRPRQLGVTGVPLHHDRTSRRQGRGGVAAGDREREGEVRRREDGDRAEGAEQAAQLGPRRNGGGVGGVDDGLEVRALLEDSGEQPQLPGGAGDLTAQALGAQVRLTVGDLDERVRRGIHRLCDRAQPPGPDLAARRTHGRGRVGGEGDDVAPPAADACEFGRLTAHRGPPRSRPGWHPSARRPRMPRRCRRDSGPRTRRSRRCRRRRRSGRSDPPTTRRG